MHQPANRTSPSRIPLNEIDALNPFKINVAAVANDSEAFRKFQDDLRSSKSAVCVNTIEIMRPYLEARAKEVLAREGKIVQERSLIKETEQKEKGYAKKDSFGMFPIAAISTKVSAAINRLKEDADASMSNLKFDESLPDIFKYNHSEDNESYIKNIAKSLAVKSSHLSTHQPSRVSPSKPASTSAKCA